MRLNRLEGQVRQLTGQLEQLQFRNSQLEQQLARPQQAPQEPPRAAVLPRAAAPQPQYAPPQPQAYPPQQSNPQQQQPSYPVQQQQAYPPAPQPSGGRRGDAFDPNANPRAPGVPRTLGDPGTIAAAPPVDDEEADEPPSIGAPGGRQAGGRSISASWRRKPRTLRHRRSGARCGTSRARCRRRRRAIRAEPAHSRW